MEDVYLVNHLADPVDTGPSAADIAAASPNPIKPTKYNLGETRSPKQILLAESQGENTTQANPGGYKAVGMDIVPGGEPQPTGPVTPKEDAYLVGDQQSQTPSEDVYLTQTPSTTDVVLQGLTSTVGTIVQGAGMVGLGLAQPFVDTEQSDTIADAIHWTGEYADQLVLSKQEQANESFGQKVAGALAGAVPYIATGPAAPVIMGIAAGTKTATTLLDQGASLLEAELSAAVSAAGAVALAKISTLRPNIMESIGLTAGSNVLIGASEDLLIRNILLTDSPRLAQNYDPLDLEKRALDAVTGAAFGLGLHKYEGYQQSRREKAEIDSNLRVTTLIKGLTTEMDKVLPQYKVYEIPEGVTHEQALQHIRDTSGSLQDALQVGSEHPEWREDQRDLAKAMLVMSTKLGFDEVRYSDLTEVLSGEGVPEAGGLYSPVADRIYQLTGNDVQRNAYIMLHEATHTLTYHAIDLWKKHLDPKSRKDLTPDQQEVLAHVDGLAEIYIKAKNEAAGILPDDTTAMRLKRVTELENRLNNDLQSIMNGGRLGIDTNAHDIEIKWFDRHYGFTDLHEFISEALTSPEFQGRLTQMRVSTAELERTFGTNRIQNLWTKVRNNLAKLVGIDPSDTMLNLAFDRSVSLINSMTKSVRIGVKDTIAELEARKANTEFKSNVDATQNYIVNMMNNLRETAATKAEFLTRIADLLPTPQWRDWVKGRGNDLWYNPDTLNQLVHSSKSYTGVLDQWTRGYMNIDKMVDKVFEGYTDAGRVLSVPPMKDMPFLSRKFIYGKDALNMIYRGEKFGEVIKWVHDMAEYYKTLKQVVYERSKEHMKPLNDLPYEAKMRILDTAVWTQNTWVREQELVKKNQNWLSEEQLRARGHDDAEIAAYGGMVRAAEYLFNHQNQALIKAGKEPAIFVPGYMPHVWSGSFKVFIQAEKPRIDPDTKLPVLDAPPIKFTVEVKAFPTAWHAKSYIKEFKKEGRFSSEGHVLTLEPDKDGNIIRVSKFQDLGASIAGTIADHTGAYHNMLMLNSDTMTILKEIEENSMRGINTHVMERQDIKGWLGESGSVHKWNDKLADALNIEMFHSKENKDLITIYQNYAKKVSEFYGNAMFLDEVITPLLFPPGKVNDGKNYYGQLFDNTPNLRKYLLEFGYTFTGENLNHFNSVDSWIQHSMVELGMPPQLVKTSVRTLKNVMNSIYLKLNPGNYIGNITQPMGTLNLLFLVNAHLVAEGKKAIAPNAIESFNEGLRMRAEGLDPETADAVNWAKGQGHLEATVMNEISLQKGLEKDTTKIAYKANPWNWNTIIEKSGRTTSFIIAFQHMRKVYDGDIIAAREAAAKVMGHSMVNYNRADRPLMYTNMGIAGEFLSPFAVYRNNFYANTELSMRALKYSEPATWLPLISMQLMFVSMAGAVGLFGVQEYDHFINMANQIFGQQWPTWEEQLQKWKVPDTIAFGGLSTLVGANLSASMSAAPTDTMFQSALVPFIKSTAALVGATGMTVAANATSGLEAESQWKLNPPPKEDFYKNFNKVMPGIVKPWIKELFKQEGSDVFPSNTNLEGSFVPTANERLIAQLMGRPSIREAKHNIAIGVINRYDKIVADQYKDLIQAGVDSTDKWKTNVQSLEDLARQAFALNQTPYDKFMQDVIDAKFGRGVVPTVRWLGAGDSAYNQSKVQRYNELMGIK